MASNSTTNRVAEYKGRKYRLLWIGSTKYGQRAHLQFFDGSKDFWVAAGLVTECSGSSSYSGGYSRGSSSRGGEYCYYPCPVTGRKCCPENGPCHDCQ